MEGTLAISKFKILGGKPARSKENMVEAGQETDCCPPFASAHTDCIIAEDDEVVETFLCQVDRYELFCNFKL